MMTAKSLPADFPARLRAVRKLLLERCGTERRGRQAAALLQRIDARLQRPPRIVLLGEANSGKSTLANRLMQRELLTTDIVRNTRAPVLVRYATAPFVQVCSCDGMRHALTTQTAPRPRHDQIERIEVGVPAEALHAFEILDLPGLTTDESDIARTRRHCATAHMAIWCTVATQAWRASELGLWRSLSKRFGPASVLAVTHGDGLSAADRDKVMKRLERDAAPLFRSIVMVGDTGEPSAGGDAASTEAGSIDGAQERSSRDILNVVRAAAADIQAQRYKSAGTVVRTFSERLTRGARERRTESVHTA